MKSLSENAEIQGRTLGDPVVQLAIQDAATSLNFGPPSMEVRDKIWAMIIAAFAIVLIGSGIALLVGMSRGIAQDGVSPQLVLTVFMSCASFLAGLLAPAPFAHVPPKSNDQ
jgi:hypothetical protein